MSIASKAISAGLMKNRPVPSRAKFANPFISIQPIGVTFRHLLPGRRQDQAQYFS